MGATKIEWAQDTINVIGGCTNASPGCDRCYSRGQSNRFKNQAGSLYEGVTTLGETGVEWTGRINTNLEPLKAMRKKKRPTLVFMNSMSDWCHPSVPTEFIGEMWTEMAAQERHTFLMLTKRPQRIRKVLGPSGVGWYATEAPVPRPQPNIWIGTSIESDDYTWRADHLRATPAAVRFLSLEPLLGPLPSLDLDGIDWVIVGGESGHGSRPMHPDWVRNIQERCVESGVNFFFKQWGEYQPVSRWGFMRDGQQDKRNTVVDVAGNVLGHPDDVTVMSDEIRGMSPYVMRRVGKKNSGRELDGRVWDEMPEVARV